MSQNPIVKLEYVDMSETQTRWLLKRFEDQRTYFDQRLDRLSKEIAAAKVLILTLAIALSCSGVALAILLVFAA